MKLNIGKYAFNSKEQFNDKIESLHTINDEGESIPDSKFAVVEIGLLEVAAPTFNEDGEELTPLIMGTDYHCDMAWYNLETHPYGWKSYAVDIEGQGVHSFMGIDYQTHKF